MSYTTIYSPSGPFVRNADWLYVCAITFLWWVQIRPVELVTFSVVPVIRFVSYNIA